jgi:hypothetical protein
MFVLLRVMIAAFFAAGIDRRLGSVTIQRSRKFRRRKNPTVGTANGFSSETLTRAAYPPPRVRA